MGAISMNIDDPSGRSHPGSSISFNGFLSNAHITCDLYLLTMYVASKNSHCEKKPVP